jgi:hypothetical protein
MMKIAFSTVLSNFMKIIHVELNKGKLYLSHEGRVVAVLKVLGKDFFGESVLIKNDKADAISSPSHNILVLFILSKLRSTLSSSYVFLRKEDTALGFFLICAA